MQTSSRPMMRVSTLTPVSPRRSTTRVDERKDQVAGCSDQGNAQQDCEVFQWPLGFGSHADGDGNRSRPAQQRHRDRCERDVRALDEYPTLILRQFFFRLRVQHAETDARDDQAAGHPQRRQRDAEKREDQRAGQQRDGQHGKHVDAGQSRLAAALGRIEVSGYRDEHRRGAERIGDRQQRGESRTDQRDPVLQH